MRAEQDMFGVPRKLLPLLINLIQDPITVFGSSVRHGVELNDEEKRRQVCLALIKNAKTSNEWHRAASELDKLEDNEKWKNDPSSRDYDYELIQSRLFELEHARASYDVRRILFLVRTSLSRNLGDMGNIRLYRRSHTGTKRLIEDYISCVVSTISTLLTLGTDSLRSCTDDLHISNHEILEGLLATRQAFGRTALLFSGGATFGMYHIGVLKALFEANMLPRIVSGASAGAIVSSVLCTRTDEELPVILKEFPYGNLEFFEDSKNPDGVLARIARFLKTGAFLDNSHLTKVMQDLVGDMTFMEAHNRTRRILNICVSSTGIYEVPKLLNYITAPNVLIWSAVAASCSVPFIFSSSPIFEKDPNTGLPVPWNPSPQKWIDGSVENDLPIARLSELFNINHFIVSQVNPHIAPFLPREDSPLDEEPDSIPPWSVSYHSRPHDLSEPESWRIKISKLIFGEILHRMNMLAEAGIFRTLLTKTRSILSQKYYGDITLLPEVGLQEFAKLLKNPTTEFLLKAMLKGERATWPKLSRIQNHCAVEIALDKAILQLRAKVVFDPAKQDLRLGYYAGLGPQEKAILRAGGVAPGLEPQTGYAGRRLRVRSSEAIRVTSMAKMNSLFNSRRQFPSSQDGYQEDHHAQNGAYPFRGRLYTSKSGPNLARLWRAMDLHAAPNQKWDFSSDGLGMRAPQSNNTKADGGIQTEGGDFLIAVCQDSDVASDDCGDDEDDEGIQPFMTQKVLDEGTSQREKTRASQNPSSAPKIGLQQANLRASKSSPMLQHDAVAKGSGGKMRSSVVPNLNSLEQQAQCYFSLRPSSTASRQVYGLMMTPNIATSPEAKVAECVSSRIGGANKMVTNSTVKNVNSPGHHFSTLPLLSPGLTPPGDGMLDLSGTRAMLRRRKSAGQLYFCSITADPAALGQPGPSAASFGLAKKGNGATGKIPPSLAGGVSGNKPGVGALGLGRAKSAEQLHVKH